MKKLLSLSLMGLVSAGAFAQFALDNLVVLRVGTGAAALTNGSTQTFIDQYTQAGTYVDSTATGLYNSGTATSEGALYNSGTGLVFVGYTLNSGASVVSTTAVANPRAVGHMLFSNATVTANTLTGAFSANNIRSGASNNGTAFVTVGANTGVVVNDGAIVSVPTNSANNRVVQVIGSDAFFSTGSGATRGIYRVDGAVGAANGAGLSASLVFATGASSSPYDFQRLEDGNFIWSDDGASGGLFYWNGTTSKKISNEPTRSFVTRGTKVFATSASGANILGYDFGSTFDVATPLTGTVLATAGANTAFRGIEAVPEPASLAVLGLGILGLARRRRNK